MRAKLSEEQIQALEEYTAANPHWDRKSVPDGLIATGKFPDAKRKSLAGIFKTYFKRKTASTVCTHRGAFRFPCSRLAVPNVPNSVISVGPEPPPPVGHPPAPTPTPARLMHRFTPSATFALSPHAAAAAPAPAAAHPAALPLGQQVLDLYGARILKLSAPAPSPSPHARDVVTGPLGVFGYFYHGLFQLCGPIIIGSRCKVAVLEDSGGREISVRYSCNTVSSRDWASSTGDHVHHPRFFDGQGAVHINPWELHFTVTVPDGRCVINPDPALNHLPFATVVTDYMVRTDDEWWVRSFALECARAPQADDGLDFSARKRPRVKAEVCELQPEASSKAV